MGVKGRLDLYVVSRFLDALANGPRSRSQLQRAAGVNYDIYQRYEEQLIAKGYLKMAGKNVAMTQNGRALRRELAAWLTRLFGA